MRKEVRMCCMIRRTAEQETPPPTCHTDGPRSSRALKAGSLDDDPEMVMRSPMFGLVVAPETVTSLETISVLDKAAGVTSEQVNLPLCQLLESTHAPPV